MLDIQFKNDFKIKEIYNIIKYFIYISAYGKISKNKSFRML